MAWWRDAVLYHVYLRSFADSDGDGVGDLAGLIGRLDHLEWLGVDALWLSPVGRSANEDWGYDVCSYDEVDPELGTSGELERLIGRRRAGDQDRARPRPEPHLRSAPVVRRPGEARLVRLGGARSGRWPAEQLEVDLRRRGLEAGRDERAVLPAQLPRVDARPELVEPRGARRVRGDPQTLVRPRPRRGPDRRRARPLPRPPSARQPAGASRRRRDGQPPRPVHEAQPEPAGGARPLPGLAPARRGVRPGAAAARRDLRRRPRPARRLLRGRRRTPAGDELRRSSTPSWTSCPRSSRRPSGRYPALPGPSSSARATTTFASPRAGPAATRRSPAVRCWRC